MRNFSFSVLALFLGSMVLNNISTVFADDRGALGQKADSRELDCLCYAQSNYRVWVEDFKKKLARERRCERHYCGELEMRALTLLEIDQGDTWDSIVKKLRKEAQCDEARGVCGKYEAEELEKRLAQFDHDLEDGCANIKVTRKQLAQTLLKNCHDIGCEPIRQGAYQYQQNSDAEDRLVQLKKQIGDRTCPTVIPPTLSCATFDYDSIRATSHLMQKPPLKPTGGPSESTKSSNVGSKTSGLK